ncbi:hypothetical protein ACET3X_006535 [Alternaria dauci]|uniref:alpha-galactosidase n=1 Tax=Alternaria dauci TaxID=48095 RepID=A0ABR3UGF3_9PLEO
MHLWLVLLGCYLSLIWAQNASFTPGQKFQIVLLGIPDMSKIPISPVDAPVWDIDLFDNPGTTVATLKAASKVVICYFSAGTAEDWRQDYGSFAAADLGKVLPEWPNERWLRTGSQSIRALMAKRIKLAADKGCDAIDPDNTDGYQNDNGLNLKNTDAIDYVRWMQQEAAKYNMRIGLKNSLDILKDVSPIIDFAVNEQCAQQGECQVYENFIALNKPVFHIERYITTKTVAPASTTKPAKDEFKPHSPNADANKLLASSVVDHADIYNIAKSHFVSAKTNKYVGWRRRM